VGAAQSIVAARRQAAPRAVTDERQAAQLGIREGPAAEEAGTLNVFLVAEKVDGVVMAAGLGVADRAPEVSVGELPPAEGCHAAISGLDSRPEDWAL